MTIKYLLDTNIISEPIKLKPNLNVVKLLNLHRNIICLASVTIHEIEYGLYRLPESKRRQLLSKYLHESILSLPILSYELKSAQWHAEERARLSKIGKSSPFIDGQIASIAFCNNLILVTNNVTDFENFEGLKIENWFIP